MSILNQRSGAPSSVDPQTTREFWDNAHRTQHLGNITGSAAEYELLNLKASDLAVPGARVLNIGLGTGSTTETLITMGCRVSVHDISPVAMEKFGGRVEGAYLPEDLPKLPSGYFDVALSHLVMQHMKDEDLVWQMRHVIRSLKPLGSFAFQFITAWQHPRDSFLFDVKVDNTVLYCRTPAWMARTVEAAGGILLQHEITENFHWKFAWCVGHAMPFAGMPTLRPKSARHPAQ